MRPPKNRSVSPSLPKPTRAAPGAGEWLPRAALLGVVLVVYANAFGLGTALDGMHFVSDDARTSSFTLRNLELIFTTDYWWPAAIDRLYRPLTVLSFLVNRVILGGGTSPFGFHAVNIMLHAGNALLAFAVARRILGNVWPAFFAAALWAAHPVGVDAVANIAGRADLLSTFGVLSGLWLYGCAPAAGAVRWARLAGLFFCAALAMGSKESGAALIGLIVLDDMVRRDKKSLRGRLPAYVAVAAGVALFLVLRWRVTHAMPEPFLPFVDNPMRGAGFWAARWTAVKIVALDLAILIWPAGLASDRSFNQIPIAGLSDPVAWIGLAVAVGILATAIALRKREPLWFWAAGFFGIALLPSSNLAIIIGASMAERFLYLPGIAFAVAATALVFRFASTRNAGMILSAAIALAGVRTLARNPAWDSTLTLMTADAPVATESFRVRAMHGEQLYLGTRNLEGAISEVAKAWSILEPLPVEQNDPLAAMTLGNYYGIKANRLGQSTPQGREWLARATPLVERAAEIARSIQQRMDEAQLRAGKPLAARRPYEQVFIGLADNYRARGRTADATNAYAEARRIAPLSADGWDGAARAYIEGGQPALAARIELAASFVQGMTPKAVKFVREAYGRVAGGECAVSRAGGADILNLGCPKVREDLCPAFAEIRRTMSEARDPVRAADLARTGEQYGCR